MMLMKFSVDKSKHWLGKVQEMLVWLKYVDRLLFLLTVGRNSSYLTCASTLTSALHDLCQSSPTSSIIIDVATAQV